ncbi:RusA family crossover junction endodeoxyribonuclease [Variovorax sp. DXTD-1]|uniref:RusA family crossover junction endodeoxyribonuclease n=1 Tax=Variovorax sp. DXTD-1 TaxID=2495592 RepID=UPI000F877C6B|nr:RusA family crossover junction endodeoxyribonuclease [Variovorax sp. DXTD-1]RST54117.1 RusA family crossover junction endodeoxyribonuclease [Variovorax sp. DXTD-1]
MITLTLPYPISANRYWRTAVRGTFVSTYVSKEAQDFKEQVGWLCKAAGIRAPLVGRVAIEVQLYPNRPQDFKTRMRKLGAAWDDTVQCLDIDNANKVLLDSLKGIAIEDDKWVRRLSSERMEPDEHGARVVVRIEQLAVPVVQGDLLGAVA